MLNLNETIILALVGHLDMTVTSGKWEDVGMMWFD